VKALQRKTMALYEFIGSQLYLAPADLDVGGRPLSSTLLLSLLNCILRTNALLVGEYGTGKTSIAELVGCIVVGFPLNALIHCQLRASPEITESSVVGRLHFGDLNQGRENVVWALFAKSPVHTVDELPRMSEMRQALLLEGIRTGQWIYLGQMLQTARSALFATANWEELGGSFDVTPALRDRFAVAVETLYAGARSTARIASLDHEKRVEDLQLNWRCDEAVALLNRDYDPASLSSFADEFKSHIESVGVPCLREPELRDTRLEIRRMKLTAEAQLFFEFMTSSLNFCVRTGMKRSARFGEGHASADCPSDCRFAGTSCSRILNGGSRRKESDILLYAKALAWLVGASEVEIPHLRLVAPYALWHRSVFANGFLSELKSQRRRLPLHLEAAHWYIDELADEFRRRKPMLVEALRFLDDRSSRETAEGILIDGKSYTEAELTHPFLIDCMRHPEEAVLGEGG